MKKLYILFGVFIFAFTVLVYFFSIGNQAGVELQYLTWQEADKVFEDHDTVVISLGAITKEHGPHLPLNNDYIMAEYLAKRVLKELDVALMPTIPFGFYPSFLEYPGSVSLKPETFKNLIKDICGSIAGYGIKKFYIINTGVSTARVLSPAKDELFEESGILMEYTDIIKAGEDAVHAVETQEGGTHADEIETSMMLYIKPDIVDMNKAVKDYDPRNLRSLTRDRNRPHTYSPTGIWGNPTLATKEKGQKVTEAVVRDILKDIKALMDK